MKNSISNFSNFELSKYEMKSIFGGTNYDCYCSKNGYITGGFGFTTNKDAAGAKAISQKLAKQAGSNCQNATITCGHY